MNDMLPRVEGFPLLPMYYPWLSHGTRSFSRVSAGSGFGCPMHCCSMVRCRLCSEALGWGNTSWESNELTVCYLESKRVEVKEGKMKMSATEREKWKKPTLYLHTPFLQVLIWFQLWFFFSFTINTYAAQPLWLHWTDIKEFTWF